MLSRLKMFRRPLPHSLSSRPPRLRPGFEQLEDRCTPSLLAGTIHANTAVAGQQGPGSVAAAANGIRVAAWINSPTGTTGDVRARLFNAAGAPLTGEIIVGTSAKVSVSPEVSVDNAGNAVVVYARQTTAANIDVVARRINNIGGLVGGLIPVATSATLGETNPSVSSSGLGHFVVTFQVVRSPTNSDVYAKMYSPAGVFQKTIAVAATAANELIPDVERSRGSNPMFSIVYASSAGLKLHRYNATGTLLSAHTLSASAAATSPEVAIDDFGNSVAVWQEASNIFARKVSAAGIIAVLIGVATTTTPDFEPCVAMDRTDGDYVVSYHSRIGTNPTRFRCIVVEMNSIGTKKATLVVGEVIGPSAATAIAIDAADRYCVGFAAFNVPGDPGFGLFARRGVLV